MWPRPTSASLPTLPRTGRLDERLTRGGSTALCDLERDPKKIAVEQLGVPACEIEMRRLPGVLEGHAGVGMVDDRGKPVGAVSVSAWAPGQRARFHQLPGTPGDQILRKRIEDSADARAAGRTHLTDADEHVAPEVGVIGQAAAQASKRLGAEEGARGRPRAGVRVRRDDVEPLSIPEAPARRSRHIAGA